MLNSYRSRAFLLLALIAAEPAASSVARASEPETLWDVLARIDNTTSAAQQMLTLGSGQQRLPLGMLPGFTLPAADRAAGSGGKLASGKPRRRIFGPFGDWVEKMEQSSGTSIKMRGYSNLSYRMDNVSGGTQATQSYQDDQYLGQGSNGLYNDTNLDIDATILKSFHYQTHISNNQYGQPGDNKVEVNYQSASTHFQAGNINAGLSGNSLIDFSRYLTGMKVTNNWTPQFSTTILASRTTSQPETRTIQGADSAGPYYVFSGLIVPGSAEVRVDNRNMVQGKDYTLDNQTGELNFLNGIIVLHTSTIAVTYEVEGVNLDQSSIYGFRTDYSQKGAAHFGLTYVTQLSQSNGAPTAISQSFPGYVTPGAAYALDYPIDQTKPVVVTVNGVPQQQGVDWSIDTQFPYQIHVAQAVPSTETVIVKYYPANTSASAGNRTVFGLDGSMPLGHIGKFTMEAALSGVSLSGNNVGGRAAQLRVDLNPFKSLHTNITIKDIGAAFTGIESAGFNRNEKSVDVSSEYSPSNRLHLTLDLQKAKRPSYTSTGTTSDLVVSTVGNDDYQQYSAGITYDFLKNGTLSYIKDSMNTNFAVGGHSNSQDDALTAHYTLGSVGLETGISRNLSNTDENYTLTSATTTTGTTSQLYATNTSSITGHVGLTWAANRWFRLRTSYSDSRITDTSSSTPSQSDARNADATADFNLPHHITLQYGLTLSDTGNLASETTTTSTTSTTTTGSSGTAGLVNGTLTSRAFFARNPYWFSPFGFNPFGFLSGRDSTTGSSSSTVGTTTFGSSTTLGTLAGAGYNSNLGSSGNYGGLYGTSSSSNYGVSSLAGRSVTNHINLSYSPSSAFHSEVTLLTSSSLGGYLYDSNRRDATLNLAWTPSERMQFRASYTQDNIAYTGTVGGSNTNSIQFYLDTRLFRKLNATLGYQLLRSRGAVNLATTSTSTTTDTSTGATTSSSLTNTDSNSNTLQLHLDYPVSPRQSLFLEYSSTLTSGFEGNMENHIDFGMQFRILAPLGFSLGWQFTTHRNSDVSQASYNYATSSLVAQLGLQF